MRRTGDGPDVQPRRDPTLAYIPLGVRTLLLGSLAATGIGIGAYAILSSLARLPGWFPAVAFTMLAITAATIAYSRLVISRRARFTKKETP